jgi:hypothetical protein
MPRGDADVHMAATHKGHQQVDCHRAVGGGVTHVANRVAQVFRRKQPERAEAARIGNDGGRLLARQATAHSGLGDLNVEPEPVK